MAEELVCWNCGESIDYLTPPIARLDACKACDAEIHVCKMCVDYDTSYAHHCREPTAEEVKDKERANFCDFFTASPDAYIAQDKSEADGALSKLEDLFGGSDSD